MVTVPPRFGVCAVDAAGRAMEPTAAPARPSPPRTRSSRRFMARFKPGRRACRPGRHTMPVPSLREVVPHGVVLDAAVVPEGDGALLPAEAALEFRRLDVSEEELQDRVALRPLELDDARREAAVHE